MGNQPVTGKKPFVFIVEKRGATSAFLFCVHQTSGTAIRGARRKRVLEMVVTA
ncbi:MAG: hypothetical protein JWR87_3444 [Segetibacter sp.]|nr:hypothetical protein [Segetibacter sp.]